MHLIVFVKEGVGDLTAEIKQISFSKYQLKSKFSLSAVSKNQFRCGALLKFEFVNGEIGYADCHPWEELGDLSLEEHLNLLSHNKFTSISSKSLFFAKIDAKNRSLNRSVFLNKKNLKNHFITSYENISESELLKLKERKFNFIKLKMGKNFKTEIEFIKKYFISLNEKGIKLRLDFNSSFDFDQITKFLEQIRNELEVIDFIEDPFEFHFEQWQEIQNKFSVNLAIDKKTESTLSLIKNKFFESENAFKVIIIKPAVEEISFILNSKLRQRIIFTSYMDHPFGQMCALFEAQSFYEQYPDKREECGFLTHLLYEKNDYAKEFNLYENILSSIQEFGFGFHELLEKEKWIVIKMK